MNRPMLIVRNVLVNNNREILLGLRADSLMWECPGGKVDEESSLDGAKREQLEETGIELLGEPELIDVVDTVGYFNRAQRFCDVFYQWSAWNGEAVVREPKKCLEWRWFAVNELPEKLFISTEICLRKRFAAATVSYARPRHTQWPKVRADWLKEQPTCQACGGRKLLQVHHKLPFWRYPELELSRENLITLCESPGHNCHFVFGHFMDWASWNPKVDEMVNAYYQEKKHSP